MSVTIQDIFEYLFGKQVVQCSQRFTLTNADVRCDQKNLFATAEIGATSDKDKEIVGVMFYLFESGADLATSTFSGGILGPAMNNPTTFKLPMTLSTTFSPFDITKSTKVRMIVVITSPGGSECYLDKEIPVTPKK
jgi:hypothetical protein